MHFSSNLLSSFVRSIGVLSLSVLSLSVLSLSVLSLSVLSLSVLSIGICSPVFAQNAPAEDDLQDISETKEDIPRSKDFVFERVHQFKAAKACQYKDGEYHCDAKELSRVAYDIVTFDSGKAKGGVGIYLGEHYEQSPSKIKPFDDDKTLDKSLFTQEGSTLCIRALEVTLQAGEESIIVDWEKVAISIDGKAMNTAPGFTQLSTATLAQKNTVVPPHSRLEESLHVLHDKACLTSFSSKTEGDSEISLWLPYEVGDEKSVLKWTRSLTLKRVSEKEAMSWVEEPQFSKHHVEEQKQKMIDEANAESPWKWFGASACSMGICFGLAGFSACSLAAFANINQNSTTRLPVYAAYPTAIAITTLIFTWYLYPAASVMFIYKGLTIGPDEKKLQMLAEQAKLDHKETKEKHAAWVRKRRQLGIASPGEEVAF